MCVLYTADWKLCVFHCFFFHGYFVRAVWLYSFSFPSIVDTSTLLSIAIIFLFIEFVESRFHFHINYSDSLRHVKYWRLYEGNESFFFKTMMNVIIRCMTSPFKIDCKNHSRESWKMHTFYFPICNLICSKNKFHHRKTSPSYVYSYFRFGDLFHWLKHSRIVAWSRETIFFSVSSHFSGESLIRLMLKSKSNQNEVWTMTQQRMCVRKRRMENCRRLLLRLSSIIDTLCKLFFFFFFHDY